ncbi:MAG: RagB/SusD family nutrient uptake outer membrane protein [Candidatus Cyclobacteriaceae bacterium M3_2C_046]
MKKISILIVLFTFGIITACEEFLDREPQGVLSEQVLTSPEGVNALLIAAYSALDGNVGAGNWGSSTTNWIYGSVVSDNAYKGSDAGDQRNITFLERYNSTPDLSYFNDKWRTMYDGVARSNDVLRLVENVEAFTEDQKNTIRGEGRFLRGFFYFELKKIFNMVPYVDETTEDFNQPNNQDIWPQIEADLEFASQNLPNNQDQPGRADAWAAKALLAKAHLYQNDYSAAKPLLDEIINQGPFDLVDCYHDNFQISTNNNQESIFEIQMSVNDGGQGQNGNYGDVLNYPYTGGPGTCCGFHQPSQNLVNAFKTQGGLPLLDTFNDEDIKSDQGLSSEEDFVPYDGPLDPRLDWTVGRRGIPYLDWGPHPGNDWIRDQAFGGPYAAKKNVYYKAEEGSLSTSTGWARGPNANNFRYIRLAHVLLWRAEVAVEENDLDYARELVNQVRERADGCVVTNEDGTPAANYEVSPYPASAFSSQDEAWKIVRFETRLESAMEGHRFFDLRRWGIADEVLNDYIATEGQKRSYLRGAAYDPEVDDYFPIPLNQIDIMGSDVLQQNPGYGGG